jgi:hypothetical protein
MAFIRFSSLHTIFFLSIFVLGWLAWSNIRLRGTRRVLCMLLQTLRDNVLFEFPKRSLLHCAVYQ